MRLVYNESNSIDAHMILNLLESAGFEGSVEGDDFA